MSPARLIGLKAIVLIALYAIGAGTALIAMAGLLGLGMALRNCRVRRIGPFVRDRTGKQL